MTTVIGTAETARSEQIGRVERLTALFLPLEKVRELRMVLLFLGLAYIRSERIEGDGQPTRDMIAFHLYMLSELTTDLSNFYDESEPDVEKLLGSLVNAGWADEGSGVIETLKQLTLVVIRSEEVTSLSSDQREDLSTNIGILVEAIELLINLK